MQSGRWYTPMQAIRWTKKSVILFVIWGSVPVMLHQFVGITWIALPWQPISLIGIAVAFYLGFKNNSSYERLWEARKIWGGIVNASRTFTVMARDFVTNEHATQKLADQELYKIHKRLVHRHIAWLHALTNQLRKLQPWEHRHALDNMFRSLADTEYSDEKFERLDKYISAEDLQYIKSKGNKASHLLSLQSKDLKDLKLAGLIEDFRHMELENMVKEFYMLQGKSERIKNFPFPRQYSSANFFFIFIFLTMLPFSMLNVFQNLQPEWMVWLSIPFSALASWIFWFMEAIGEYSENPFEGLYNDVPISQMATGIEIDIRQMLDEDDLPDPVQPIGDMSILT